MGESWAHSSVGQLLPAQAALLAFFCWDVAGMHLQIPLPAAHVLALQSSLSMLPGSAEPSQQ